MTVVWVVPVAKVQSIKICQFFKICLILITQLVGKFQIKKVKIYNEKHQNTLYKYNLLTFHKNPLNILDLNGKRETLQM